MPSAELHQHRLSNGLVLVAQSIPGVGSASMTLLLPAGVSVEPTDQLGVSAVLSEMLCRGAAGRDSRAQNDALDQLGVQRGTGVSVYHSRLHATMLGVNLAAALPLLADMVLRPNLSAQALEPSKDLSLQAIDALEDDPAQKVFLLLRRRHLPTPLGRSSLGERPTLEALTLANVTQFWQARFRPRGSVLAFAGQIDFPALRDAVEAIFGPWTGCAQEAAVQSPGPRGYHHEHADSSQVHLGLAYDAPAETDPDAPAQRAAVAVLSGGTSSRLFHEVREKRGLCYSVFASYAGDRQRGAVMGYAGTTVPRAQETLEVFVGELRRLAQGVDRSEFERAMTGARSSLVMHGESSESRAGAIASDQWLLGRPRSLDELIDEVRRVTLDSLIDFLRRRPLGPLTVVTVGPQALRWEA